MSTNARPLKGYVRFDGQGRIIPGSLILRKKKPAIGTWKEVPAYECCNSVTLSYTVADARLSNVTLILFCNGTQINSLLSLGTSTTVASLVTILNNAFNVLGTFSNPSGNIIQLVMSGEQKTALCPVGTLSFTVVGA